MHEATIASFHFLYRIPSGNFTTTTTRHDYSSYLAHWLAILASLLRSNIYQESFASPVLFFDGNALPNTALPTPTLTVRNALVNAARPEWFWFDKILPACCAVRHSVPRSKRTEIRSHPSVFIRDAVQPDCRTERCTQTGTTGDDYCVGNVISSNGISVKRLLRVACVLAFEFQNQTKTCFF